ncbi:tRNA uridine-5-carboxymethylaminomethyl(34) synthesis GTPase MnmE [Oscillibacter sp. MSJ-2]|uniref:tRNA modification GTPase MnmE n=1 Tax=Dysosmobacter acutus TaxID=2841504 RepID=A0ABS6F681_9FIRM|nr:tRNA uridine-5-carboxymethylaminomethyl(34) synthesis GTPase MnmE [Dysosmobacter acutus]MBU5625804.1 tRNA uridine-5-carboxymethylaminomethyl(34) synthesis GTPase MnmE [Dysosmobacter acutus]
MEPIAAIATAPAPSAIGVIRLSGEGAAALAGRVFSPAAGRPLDKCPPRTMHYGTMSDRRRRTVDRGMAVWFPAGHSYTGEESAELYCHGSPVAMGEVLSALLEAGARQAGPGEFTRRAFLNGRMDLTSAEAVMDLIDAETAEAARLAASQSSGALGRTARAVYDDLLDLSARFSAVVDYPDEDLEDVRPDEIRRTLDGAEETLSTLLSSVGRGAVMRSGVPTALIGRPNAGKSSLLNALAGTERVIVTARPGTTRDTVEEPVRLGDVTLRLIDTAGIRDAEEEAERLGVERSRRAAAQAELAILVIDGSATWSSEDEQALRAASAAKRLLVVRSKADLPQDAGVAERFPQAICVSAKTGRGIEDIERAVGGLFPSPEAAFTLTNQRQQDAVRRASNAVQRARQALELTPDAALTDVEEAMAALGELLGRTPKEDIVEQVFARFCVGK